MNLQQLKVFVLTVKLKNLSLVASALNIKQPTVTFHLNKLQEYWDVPLFVTPSYHVIRLTDAGQALYRYAQQAVSITDEIEQLMTGYKQVAQGHVSLGSTHTPATYLLPPLLAEYKKLYPSVKISLEVKTAPVVIHKIKQFELDFGLVSFDKLDDKELQVTASFRDDLIVVCHPDHPLAACPQPDPQTIAAYPFIAHEAQSVSRQLIDSWAQQHRLALDTVIEVSSTETMKEIIRSNIGIGILSRISVMRELEQGSLCSVELPGRAFDRHIYLVHHRSKLLGPAMKAFISLLSERLFEGVAD